MRLEDSELLLLLADVESHRVERKERLNDGVVTAINEAICAFSNDLAGEGKAGVIFVGVRNDGSNAGLDIDDRLLLTLSNMKTEGQIVPPPSMLVEKRRLNGGDLAVVTVLPSDSPPVRCKGVIHVRVGPRKGRATAQDEARLNERRRSRNIPFDIQPIRGVGMDALNLALFREEYLGNAFSPDVLEANERSIEQQLAATKMIATADDPVPTVLGALVIGKRSRDLIGNSYVQFLRIDGHDLSDPIIDDEAIDGTISEILRRIDEKMKAHIRTRIDLTSDDTEVRSVNYPLAALQQLVRNAVMHRTYEATHAPVRITWFNDRIEIHNPGGPFGLVNQGNFGHPGLTDYRNPNLADAMKVLGYVQRFGVGIATARRLLREAGHPVPEFDISENFVVVTVRGKD